MEEAVQFGLGLFGIPEDDEGFVATESEFEGVGVAFGLGFLEGLKDLGPLSGAGGEFAFADHLVLDGDAAVGIDAGAFGLGSTAFGVGAEGDGADEGDEGDGEGAGENGAAVASRPEFGFAEPAGGSGGDGAEFEEGAEVGGEEDSVGVATGWVAGDGFFADGGEVAREGGLEGADRIGRTLGDEAFEVVGSGE